MTRHTAQRLCLFLCLACLPLLSQAAYAKPKVLSGLDVLQADNFAALKGKKVGLITNHSGINAKGEHILDLMHDSPDVEVVASVEADVTPDDDSGAKRRPTAEATDVATDGDGHDDTGTEG